MPIPAAATPAEGTPAYFESLFAASDDPWQFRSRWYETRKRALTLACLPAARFASAYEPGCANGELAAALAERCDRLLASDGAAGAVTAARARLADQAHVSVVQAWVPQDWPDGRFDLIVVSELGYYLDPAALDTLAQRARASLAPGGTVLACHWRPPIGGCVMAGDEVQRRLGDALGLPRLMEVTDADLRLEVWCDDTRSVAAREGLR